MCDARLTRYAQANRKELSKPAVRIWLQVRAKRFLGVKFRREKIIGRYIADFAANDPPLVIEIDGETHAADTIYDTIRTRYLNRKGYRVVCYANPDIMQNLDGVLMHLAAVIEEERRNPPLPTLSPEGERAQ